MFLNGFGVMVFLVLVILLIVCLHQFLMVHLPSSSCFHHLHLFLFLQKSLDVFALFITLVQALINLTPILPSLFVGYSRTQKGYHCYSPALRRYFTSADVTFFEFIPFFSNTFSSVECDPLPLPTLTLSPSQSPNLTQPSPVPLKVYSRRLRLPAPMPQPVVPPSSDPELPSTSDSLPIALRKGCII
ncbi:uncharacterized protein LOC122293310 [Carya illinoinensis]|uniref:uncharacterized protein LOC122293310 n=1 Tax=Carya illinoinensis TaxID=32201 RepID=UPI001C71BC9E|nr:uncharacterized protein LOC122293310 [Carya illinoinensis]